MNSTKRTSAYHWARLNEKFKLTSDNIERKYLNLRGEKLDLDSLLDLDG